LASIGRQPEVPNKKIDIVVPAWDNFDLTQSCLASIRRGTRSPYRIILVDNGSTDDVGKIVSGGDLLVIRNMTNLKWCRAVNQGLDEFRKGDATHVCLLNNDTEVADGWDEALLKHFEDDPRVGAVAPATTGIDGIHSIYVDNGRKWESMWFLTYAQVLLSRAAIEKVGGLDERFEGLGSDDLDHGIRLRKAGFRCILDRKCIVKHKPHSSFKKLLGTDTVPLEYWSTGQKLLIEKHGQDECIRLNTPKPAIGVCIPTSGWVHPQWLCHTIMLLGPQSTHYPLNIINPHRCIVDVARNKAVEVCLENDYDYIFWLDDDTFAPMGTIDKFVQQDLDICFALTFQRQEPYHCCAFVWIPDSGTYHPILPARRGVIPVDSVGMAATLVKTSVYAKMKSPWYLLQQWIPEIEKGKGDRIGEDVWFCREAKKAGIGVYCDTNTICGHMAVEGKIADENTALTYLKAKEPGSYEATMKLRNHIEKGGK
jgi:GT2 family glycosyltransferase